MTERAVPQPVPAAPPPTAVQEVGVCVPREASDTSLPGREMLCEPPSRV